MYARTEAAGRRAYNSVTRLANGPSGKFDAVLQVENGELGGTVVKVRGDLDFTCRDAFRKTLDFALDGSRRGLTVSLEKCRFCDCAAIGVLVAVRKTIGSHLKVIIPPDGSVRRLFELAGLLQHFGIAPNVSVAATNMPCLNPSRGEDFAYPAVA